MTARDAARTVAVLAAVLALAAPAPAQTRPISEEDLLAFVWVADPQMAPDGSRVAFVRVSVDGKQETYVTSLWLAEADGSSSPRPLTAGPRDTAPRWSPDGRRLAFVRSVESGGRAQPGQIYVLDMAGGDARPITTMPRGAANPEWSPDGRTIAFTSGANAADLEKAKNPAAQGSAPRPRESDVRVITRAVYRSNGVADFGYADPDRPSHVWTVAVPDAGLEPPLPVQVTSGEFAERNVKWSPDGSRLFFVSNRVREEYFEPPDADLYSVPAAGGEIRRVAGIDGAIGDYAFSPDGRRVAFAGTLNGEPIRSYSQTDLFVADLAGGGPRNLTAGYDFDVDGGLGGDQRAPRGGSPSAPAWSADGRSLLVKVGEQGDANLKRVDVATGAVEPVTTGRHDVMSYTADARGGAVALVLSSQTVVGDLQVLDARTGAMRRLTGFNDALFGRLSLSEPEEIWYASFDGRRIQGWILKPPGFEPAQKYPLILEIHGGPHSAYGNTFTHEFQWLAAKGYVVLFTNPRGSSNYGQEFGNVIQFRYPGDDYRDLIAGVDTLLLRGYVDAGRMGVTGGSGGGLLTNWVVTQTTRFKAAVSQRDISDWTSFWYTSDFWLSQPRWFRKPPFEAPEEYTSRSPITYADRIQTPLLFILGDEDWRTPPSAGGEQLFRALKYLKRPTAMVRFPDENHELSRSGQPWHRVERLRHIAGWFDRHLLGRDGATYE